MLSWEDFLYANVLDSLRMDLPTYMISSGLYIHRTGVGFEMDVKKDGDMLLAVRLCERLGKALNQSIPLKVNV